ncbi:MAG: U3 snoRNP protein [Thelocarpon impressellum]|nr:MAG: U3 snoRNP protein [Thelocarpon impressellum]
MDGISYSSTSTTSHTLSVEPAQISTAESLSSSVPALLSTLSGSPHIFLRPPPSLHSAALALAKRYLDPLASTVRDVQLRRQQDARRKRKRGAANAFDAGSLLQLNRLYLEGFAIDQVWEQARRVLDATTAEVERSLPDVLEPAARATETVEPALDGTAPAEDGLQMMRFDEDGFEIVASADGSLEEDDTEQEQDYDSEGLQDEEMDLAALDEENLAYDDFNMSGALQEEEDHGDGEPAEAFVEDPNGLNDGFFSIDTFNKQSEFMERQEVAGGDREASDDDEIDWDENPLAPGASINRRAYEDDNGIDEALDDDDDDGPTFGDADLDAPDNDSGDGLDGDDGIGGSAGGGGALDNTNDILYKDFFEPPPRKSSKGGRPSKHTREVTARAAKEPAPLVADDRDIQRTMDAVRRDLFEDELSGDEDAADDDFPVLNPSDPRSRRSTHERRQAKLAEEIRKLEAANVAKREWTLSGEARAADRPLNSLLEEDLEFERAGKPVPVITAAVSEDIEEMIKRRILAQEFDEVIRRRPDDLATTARRGRFELDDSKPQQSLAEMYEEEHLRKVDPEGHRDKRDEKLDKERAEVERLWADVSSKLDALTSWHYRPKAPKPSLNIVADVPTIAMEDARPTAAVGVGNGLGTNSMLAPQEIYAPGKGSVGKGEVVPKSGAPMAREEMSREEKLRRRRREKERIKKRSGEKGPGQKLGKKGREKSEVIEVLKKGGVRVIGRKGEVKDVEGRKIKDTQARLGGGGFKL